MVGGQGIAMYAGASAAQLLPNLRKYNHIDPSAPSIIKAKMGGQDPNNIVDMLQHQATPNYQNAQALITSGQVSLIDTKITILAIDATVNSGAASTKIANNWTNLCTDLSSQSPTRNLSTIIEGYAVNNTAVLSQRLKDGQAVLGTARTYQGLSAGQPFYFVTFAAQITNAAAQTVQTAQVLLGQTGIIPQAGTATQTQNAPVCVVCTTRTNMTKASMEAVCNRFTDPAQKTNAIAALDKICNSIATTSKGNTLIRDLAARMIAIADFPTPNDLNTFLLEVNGVTNPAGTTTDFFSANIDKLNIKLLEAWLKLRNTDFSRNYDYLRSLVAVPNCNTTRNSSSKIVVVVVENGVTFTTTFDNDEILANGGTDGTNWNGILNVHPLIANANYIIESRYRYETDNIGRVIKVTTVIGTSLDKRTPARLKATTTQHARCQQLKGGTTNNAIPDDNDDAGHLIGSTFNGIGEQINLLPQVRKHNQPRNLPNGLWRRLEVDWDTNINSSVTVEITPIFIGNNRRADRYQVDFNYGNSQQPQRIITNNP